MMNGGQDPRGFGLARKAMVESQLRPSGVNDPRVVAAMATVPREAFVPTDRVSSAYSDRPIPLGGGREMNPPVITARLLTELRIQPSDRVLLIGLASGYTAALLTRLVADLVAVEENARLFALANAELGETGATLVEAPLAGGHEAGAPYDIILVDGAVQEIPDTLIAQLADGGRLATGLVVGGVGRLVVGRKAGSGFGVAAFEDGEAVRLPGFGKAMAFTF